jgi:hypothetical protein
MRIVLTILFRCVLALGLGFTPVANALSMATMAVPQQEAPPCHTPSPEQQSPAGKCCGTASHCHCAMATALPAQLPASSLPNMPSDHPQTVQGVALEQPHIPDTPPPRLIL